MSPAGFPGERPTRANEPGAASDGIIHSLLRLIDGLRATCTAVSLGEGIDAANALVELDLIDRPQLKAALRATLIKRLEDIPTFDALFDQCFPLRPSQEVPIGTPTAASNPSTVRDPQRFNGEATDPSDSEASTADLNAATLRQVLRNGSDDELRELARLAVERYSGLGSQTGSERYFVQRTMRALDLAQVLVDAMRDLRLDHGDDEPLLLHQQRHDLNARAELFKQLLAQQVRRQLFADVEHLGLGLIAPRRLDNVALDDASARELRELRAAIRPLARKLARRLAQQRRRHTSGRLDMRRTIRHSFSTGGTPLEPQLRRRIPSKPEVVVLCDISGSVAEFARFILLLLQALRSELSGLQSFVFIDGIAEITDVLANADAALDPRLLVTLPGVVIHTGHSDYDTALRQMLTDYPNAINTRSTVIIVGDARTNYRSPGVEHLKRIRQKCRSIYWFNPEPAENWNSHDSVMATYQNVCDAAYEVRTLAQLSAAIGQIL